MRRLLLAPVVVALLASACSTEDATPAPSPAPTRSPLVEWGTAVGNGLDEFRERSGTLARLFAGGGDGKNPEWRSTTIRACEALIVSGEKVIANGPPPEPAPEHIRRASAASYAAVRLYQDACRDIIPGVFQGDATLLSAALAKINQSTAAITAADAELRAGR